MSTPRIAAIHDLSGFGRCSLTVAIPVLSAMGVQCCPLPTAFLSTHTGGFQDYTFLDMTDEMPRVAEHWNSLNLRFDAIYSGFMGSQRQIAIVRDFIATFRRDAAVRVVVDPVMGDHGLCYATYTPAMCAAMADLAADADVITPNLTEAAFLLDVPYESLGGGETAYRDCVARLSLEGKRSVVLTGVSLERGKTGAACFDAVTGRTDFVQTVFETKEFHGTGDVFASVLTGALVSGRSLLEAAADAAEFVRACAAHTAPQGLPAREGVDFEPLLWKLHRG